ncbi:a-factor receptor [Extremus antarcticus]|uniref:A-factor receptor n=1 Tax=Extremus antarcticus TaxID=702011 RepID=A0AAJ0DNM6_9PEZI|nr:a-factor receptor [Extremus antarcticus]
MAVIALPAAKPVDEASTNTDTTGQVYASAIVLALFSFVLMLLIIPPMFWHARNRNIGATALVAWLLPLLLFTFANAIIWPSDDISSWFSGVGYCDIQVKIQVASQVAFPAAFACILRALAAVMDTDRATLIQTKAQRRRTVIIDLACCAGFPLLQMLLHFVVQSRRYYVYGIAGCVPVVSTSWLTIPLMVVPPLIWTLIDAYYAVLILIRLYRYRLSFNAILASGNTTRSRFLRLYLLCALWIMTSIPLQLYTMCFNSRKYAEKSYSWSQVHDSKNWSELVMVPSHGTIFYDRWIWLGCALAVFVFFGFGRDALATYRTALLALGMDRVFPGLKTGPRMSTPTSSASFGSRAKMLFKRKSSSSSFASGMQTASTTEPLSPKESFLDTIDEDDSTVGTTDNRHHTEKTSHNSRTPSLLARVSSLFRSSRSEQQQSPAHRLPNLSFQHSSVESTISSAERTPSMAQQVRSISPDEMVVRKEVRQGSENGV